MLDPLPRLSHGVGDGGLPTQVVLRLLVLREVVRGVIRLVQQETIGVVLGPEHIEADIARLAARCGGRCPVWPAMNAIDLLRLDVDRDRTTYIFGTSVT